MFLDDIFVKVLYSKLYPSIDVQYGVLLYVSFSLVFLCAWDVYYAEFVVFCQLSKCNVHDLVQLKALCIFFVRSVVINRWIDNNENTGSRKIIAYSLENIACA